MTKAEAIERTGSTEEDLIICALGFIKNHYKKCRNNHWEDPDFSDEDFEHYNDLVTAYEKLIEERRNEHE